MSDLIKSHLFTRTNQTTKTYFNPILGPVLITSTVFFNVVLCFINTRHWMSIGNLQISIVQLAFLSVALVAIYNQITSTMIELVIIVLTSILALWVVSLGVDMKIIFDLSLPPVFILLGRTCPTTRASQLLTFLLACVVIVGILEMFFPSQFESYLNIWAYYQNKGVISSETINYSNTGFFLSGERSSTVGRTLFAFIFSPHRASSVFLEPVSMGNFPMICLMWLLSIEKSMGIRRLALFGLIGVCVVLPDSRFAAGCCLILIFMQITGLHRSSAVILSLPFVTVFSLIAFGSMHMTPGEIPAIQADDLSGRLMWSGKLLSYWNLQNWLGLSPSPLYVADTGYAYLINNTGLPIALLLWICLIILPVKTTQARNMRGLIAVYITAGLCIGESVFSIKTAALMWFLLGAAENACSGLNRSPQTLSPG